MMQLKEPLTVKLPELSAKPMPAHSPSGLSDVMKISLAFPERMRIRNHDLIARRTLCHRVQQSEITWSIVSLLLLLTMVGIVIMFILLISPPPTCLSPDCEPCASSCSIEFTETLPPSLGYTPIHPTISDTWLRLIALTQDSLNISSMYWTLNDSDINVTTSFAQNGQAVLSALQSLQHPIRVTVSDKNFGNNNHDILTLPTAETRILTMPHGGILHSKLWGSDYRHAFIGSPNMDFRALSLVKEIGVAMWNCSCLASDVSWIQYQYWQLALGINATRSVKPFNADHPYKVLVNNITSQIYLSVSPPSLAFDDRTGDRDAIVRVIGAARRTIAVSIMDYSPTTHFNKPVRMWPDIDDALRAAAFDSGCQVRLLVSHWQHTSKDFSRYLRSLSDFSPNIEVRVFQFPNWENTSIPATAVNHAKFLVTETVAYIGTSNWNGDYFTSTAGVGFVLQQSESDAQRNGSLVKQLQTIFDRDWTSPWALNLTDFP